MKDGICPKCNTGTVYCKLGGVIYGGTYIHTSGRISKRLDMYYYICSNCGLTESYVADKEVLSDVALTWRKVK
jgi:transcription elongation factor Elf1